MPDWLKVLRPVDRELMARWTAEQGQEPWWTGLGLGLSPRAIALMDRVMFALAAELPADMRGVYAEVPKGFG